MNQQIDIATLNSVSVNNYIENVYSVLNQYVILSDIEKIKQLLELGANPNGITSSGLAHKIPLTCIDFTNSLYREVIKILLTHGANVNSEDLSGNTLLTYFTSYLVKRESELTQDDISTLLFILQRGACPNGTLFHNPLLTLMIFFVSRSEVDRPILIEMIEIHLSYGADPKRDIIKLDLEKNKTINAYEALNFIDDNIDNYIELKYLFDISVIDLMIEENYKHLLNYVLKCYKTDTIEELKDVIKYKKEFKNKDRYDEFNIYNEDFISGASIYSVPREEILFLTQDNRTFCFHVSEIPTLLELRKNPFTKVDLEPAFIETIFNTDYFPLIVREDCLEKDIFEFKETTITSEILIQKLEMYIKTFNTYLSLDKLKELSLKDLIDIQNNIYDNQLLADDYSVTNMFMVNCFNYTKPELIINTVTIMLTVLRSNQEVIPFMSNLLSQLMTESEIAREILSLFPRRKKIQVIRCVSNHSYVNFMNYISYAVISNEEDVSEIKTNIEFKSFVEKDFTGILTYMEMDDVRICYQQFIRHAITDKLKDLGNVRDVWTDLVPAFIRQLS